MGRTERGGEPSAFAGAEAVPRTERPLLPSHAEAQPGVAGRGQEGRESRPKSPLTQCLEAREGRRADGGCPFLSSWETDIGLALGAP